MGHYVPSNIFEVSANGTFIDNISPILHQNHCRQFFETKEKPRCQLIVSLFRAFFPAKKKCHCHGDKEVLDSCRKYILHFIYCLG